MAERCLSFQGVVVARYLAEKQEQEKKNGPAPTPARSSKPAKGEVRHVTLHQMMLIDPSLVQYEKG